MPCLITMSQKELHRLEVIQKIRDRRLSVVQAAELLGLSRLHSCTIDAAETFGRARLAARPYWQQRLTIPGNGSIACRSRHACGLERLLACWPAGGKIHRRYLRLDALIRRIPLRSGESLHDPGEHPGLQPNVSMSNIDIEVWIHNNSFRNLKEGAA
ncbi:hypothetical protein GGE50_002068 [Rhizobium leguminosarum]|jgi:hypothetical protein|nr:hypothetical protein [Rhizobium leguminosarum]MDH6660161.1 hypothetical protein [Rhizobium sophorae]ASS58636.1 hypothetical protein CHR56_29130 [Rhizobium leguminosarum bv. viciae]MBB4332204.1 hypothetical protein [Rhizobium leguminosarum]MBB4342826.1 hypothetical protein [Rhizobium leguminosarum]MBB4357831.1 hypothetical protein [Rhizobium leguminosarum]